jgi:hypothetical protein
VSVVEGPRGGQSISGRGQLDVGVLLGHPTVGVAVALAVGVGEVVSVKAGVAMRVGVAVGGMGVTLGVVVGVGERDAVGFHGASVSLDSRGKRAAPGLGSPSGVP